MAKKIFPSINSYHLGHDKIEMTRSLWAAFPQHVPQTIIEPSNERGIEVILNEMFFPFVVKEVRSSQEKGVRIVADKEQFLGYARNNTVLYAQEKLPITRDLRVVYVGDEILTAYWRIGREGEFRNNVAQGGSVTFEEVPDEALELTSAIARKFGIDHAGFDIAVVAGHCYILEFNILFGNQALRQNNIPLEQKILEYLERQSTPPFPFSPDFGSKKIS